MTPPRRDLLADARRQMEAAAAAIDGMRRLTGSSGAPAAPAADRVRSEALAAAREYAARCAAELAAERARGAALLEEVGRLREELASRPTARELESAREAGGADSARRAEELARQVVALKERVTLLGAEHVRLETLRRKAEAFGAGSEESRRSAEAVLRRELLAAHAALDRAAIESGIRDAKAITEIEDMRKRLDQALTRLQSEERARRQTLAEEPSYKADLESAEAVIASLRRELSQLRAAAVPPADLVPEDDAGEEAEVEYPPMEYALEPGWARLIDLVKPPLQAAYGHLRRLSAAPLSAGSRAILRLTGASLSQAADSLATIELALSDSPATTESATVAPALESALSAWEPVLRRRGITLTREISRGLPDSPHDAEQLRLALHHVLRNAVEALPRGAVLRVELRKSAANAVALEFRDDGPGYPPAWIERRFEPFAAPRKGHAGLGLAAVRRALRRWGGEAEASSGPSGRGACLTLTFAPAPARPAAKS